MIFLQKIKTLTINQYYNIIDSIIEFIKDKMDIIINFLTKDLRLQIGKLKLEINELNHKLLKIEEEDLEFIKSNINNIEDDMITDIDLTSYSEFRELLENVEDIRNEMITYIDLTDFTEFIILQELVEDLKTEIEEIKNKN